MDFFTFPSKSILSHQIMSLTSKLMFDPKFETLLNIFKVWVLKSTLKISMIFFQKSKFDEFMEKSINHQISTSNPSFCLSIQLSSSNSIIALDDLTKLWTANLPLQSQDFEISSKSMSESSNSGFPQKVLSNSKIMTFGQRRQFDALNVQIIKRVDFHSLNAQIIISSFSDVKVRIWVSKSKSGILPFPHKS